MQGKLASGSMKSSLKISINCIGTIFVQIRANAERERE